MITWSFSIYDFQSLPFTIWSGIDPS